MFIQRTSQFCRAIVYAVFASLIWFLSTLAPPRVERSEFAVLASICVLGGVACFPVLAFARRKRWGALSECLLGIVGRTGCPSCVALYCVATMEPNDARAFVYRLLAWYFITAPCLLFALNWRQSSNALENDAERTTVESP